MVLGFSRACYRVIVSCEESRCMPSLSLVSTNYGIGLVIQTCSSSTLLKEATFLALRMFSTLRSLTLTSASGPWQMALTILPSLHICSAREIEAELFVRSNTDN